MSELRVYTPPADGFGSDGYPVAWHEIKHLVRSAAGDRCERCSHPYQRGAGKWSECDSQCEHGGPVRPDPIVEGVYQAAWRILTVHHLTGDKADCRWWNLAALCQRCHLQIQGRVRMHQVWPHEHTPWFQPHAAGFYAWAYLGEDVTRDEALVRMNELLSLERVA